MYSLEPGADYTREEIEHIFGRAKGAFATRGIHRIKENGSLKAIVLLSFASDEYEDEVTADSITYWGMKRGDNNEIEHAWNTGIVNASENNIPVYFFNQEDDGGPFKSYGEVEVSSTKETDREGDINYLFTLKPKHLFSEEEIQKEEHEIESQLTEEPLKTTEVTYEVQKQQKRNTAFAKIVKEQYNAECAVCGSDRKSPDGNPEVEAAHIYPKSHAGADDPRNGIALCRLHHWAFDAGWLSLTDDLRIMVKEKEGRSEYDEFKSLAGQKIKSPNDESHAPHPKFIEEHRDIHGF